MALHSESRRTPPAPLGRVSSLPLRKLVFTAMATQCEVQYAAPGGDDQAAVFERQAVDWVNAFEAKYTRFRTDSLVGRINAAAGKSWVEVDPEMEQMLKLCDTVHFMTQGILDPTALPLIRIWNWKAVPAVIPSAGQIAAAKKLVGWHKVQRAPGKVFLPEEGMALDFGGFGKEYAVDMVAQIARDAGIDDVLVDFGHDIRVFGAPPGRPAWHIGIEDPGTPGAATESLALFGSKGVASSGDYLRCFTLNGRRYGHILDVRTGWPVGNGCTQSTVIANTCLLAGILSTTSFVLGPAKGLELIQASPGAEGMLRLVDSRAQTRGFYQYVVSS